MTPLARLPVFKEFYLTIFAGLLFEFHSRWRQRVCCYEAIGSSDASVFDRYNIVSEDDLIDASTKLQEFLVEAIKEERGSVTKVVTIGLGRARLLMVAAKAGLMLDLP